MEVRDGKTSGLGVTFLKCQIIMYQIKEILLCLYTVHFETDVHLKLNLNVISILNIYPKME